MFVSHGILVRSRSPRHERLLAFIQRLCSFAVPAFSLPFPDEYGVASVSSTGVGHGNDLAPIDG